MCNRDSEEFCWSAHSLTEDLKAVRNKYQPSLSRFQVIAQEIGRDLSVLQQMLDD